MKVKEYLEKLVSEKAWGPVPLFSVFHVIRALELIAEKACGRLKLSEELKIGEGTTRTLLNRLKEAGIVTTSRTGCRLTKKGEKLWMQYRSIFKKAAQLEKNELTLAKYSVALLVKNREEKVKSGIEQRDAVIVYGGRGAVTLVCKSGKLVIPGVSQDIAKTYPRAYKQLMTLLEPKENDVIIVGYADTKENAMYGTLAAAWTLLDDC